MTLIRTHYLDWERIDPAVQPWIPFDTGDDWLADCERCWLAGYYVAGPWEEDVPRTSNHDQIVDFLWFKYNSDDRPDGQLRRSMSVGDVIQIGTQFYLCRNRGWQQVHWIGPTQ